jgi:hypothetical protein
MCAPAERPVTPSVSTESDTATEAGVGTASTRDQQVALTLTNIRAERADELAPKIPANAKVGVALLRIALLPIAAAISGWRWCG